MMGSDLVEGSVVTRKVKGLPTQVVHPWRTVARTVVQNLAGAIVSFVLWALLSIGIDVSNLETEFVTSVYLTLTAVLAGVFAKIMAKPGVEQFFADHMSFLATGVHDE